MIASLSGMNRSATNTGVKPTTVQIGLKDTLTGIAEANFADAYLAWLIAELNLPRLKVTATEGKRIIEIKEGQTIVLPLQREIDSFYEGRRIFLPPERLVTIVLPRTTSTLGSFINLLSS